MNDARPIFASAAAPAIAANQRVEAAVLQNYEFLWRCLRRLGVAEPSVEDALQGVFIVFAARIGGIADGSERAFLFATAVRVAADWRKKSARSREVSNEVEVHARADGSPGAEELLDERRARELLQEALSEMPFDLRVVLVLAELEEMTLPAIAALLGIPVGTATSRLRRARACFAEIAARMRQDLEQEGGRS
jgi:RNA polymerase sigma-70 factor (ECF subfamily)